MPTQSTRFRAAGLRDEALEMPTLQLGVLLVGLVLIGLPVWEAVDAATHPESTWQPETVEAVIFECFSPVGPT